MALMSKSCKREARVVCEQDCAFAVINKTNFDKCLEKIEKDLKAKLIDFMQKIPCFRTQSKAGIAKIVNSLKRVSYIKGQFVTKESYKYSEI